MGKIKINPGFDEGEVLYRYHLSRFNTNKNVLGVVLGSTGSGKSYTTLRILEIEYKKRFNKPFPIENVTFSIEETIKRIKTIQDSGEKGHLLMPDDIGASGYGALEFQNKTSKMFSYILQSFRSLNIGMIMTLPVLTMLNKQGRQLLHYQLSTQGIDYAKKISKVKPLMHQLNMSSGKSYWKYPRIALNNSLIIIKRFNYSMPSKELIDKYEEKKSKFLAKLTKDFVDTLEPKKSIYVPKDIEIEAYKLYKLGQSQREIGVKIGQHQTTVGVYIKKVQKYIENTSKDKENSKGVMSNKVSPVHNEV